MEPVQAPKSFVADEGNYSSPVPVIGLYMAGATLVCFLSMLHDTIVGLARKKPWLPCKLFTLNSFTFYILSVATKLPVDLTTAMPRVQDQLSKLTSTTLICICMGFLMPSLGTMARSECLSNMAALTLFVVTVIINVCIQMKTGVIFSFMVEHIIISVCMLVLLAVMWSLITNIRMEPINNRKRTIIEEGYLVLDDQADAKTLLERLKWYYLYTYSSNPQFLLCESRHYSSITILCTVSSVVLFRSFLGSGLNKELKFKFTEVNSDYQWSTLLLVLSQMSTVLLGMFTVFYRWITLLNQMTNGGIIYWRDSFQNSAYQSAYKKFISMPFKFSMAGFTEILQLLEDLVETVLFTMQMGILWMNGLVLFMSLTMRDVTRFIIKRISRSHFCDKKDILGGGAIELSVKEKHYQCAVYNLRRRNSMGLWMLRIGLEDIEKWMNSKNIPISLVECLRGNYNSPCILQGLYKHGDCRGVSRSSDHESQFSDNESQFSSLSMVVIVRLVSVALSTEIFDGALVSTFIEPLIQVFEEAFDMIHFVDSKLLNIENETASRRLQ